MKYIIIDDNIKYAERLLAELKEEGDVISSEGFVLNELANEIQVRVKNESDTVLVININLKAKNSNRQEQKGVELLIWLRIKDILNHVVLYSFETLHSLLSRIPKHLIATSQGTTFVHLPEAFKDLQNNLSKKQKDITKYLADPDNVQETLKPAFSIEQFRHREANWWGVKQLYDVHRIIENVTPINCQNIIAEKSLNLNNSVAQYIFRHRITIENVEQTEIDRRARIMEIAQNKIWSINKIISEKRGSVYIGEEEKQKLKEQLSKAEEALKSFFDNGIIKCRNEVNEEIKLWENLIETEKLEIQELEQERQEEEAGIKQKQYEITDVLAVIKELFNDTLKSYDDIKDAISKRKPRLLYIDDNANNGWHEILSQILKDVCIRPVIPDKQFEQDISALYQNLIKHEITDDISLILLDLRLFDEENKSAEVNQLSGKKLLDEISKFHKGVPVLIITASNKIWSYEELIRSGADGYWTKEGIDNNFDANDSVHNYYRLLWLVEKMTGDKYKLLKKISNLISHVENEENQWWDKSKNNRWKTNDVINGNTVEVIEILKASYELTKAYLHNFVLEYGYKNQDYEAFYLTSLINKLSNIVDVIHNVTEYDYKYLDVADLIQKRQGVLGVNIRADRNEASHRFYSNVSWERFKIFFENICKYLAHPNCSPTSDDFISTEEIKQRFSKHSKLKYPPDNFKKEMIIGREIDGLVQKKIYDSGKNIIGYRIALYPGYSGTLFINNVTLNTIEIGYCIRVKATSLTEEGQIILQEV